MSGPANNLDLAGEAAVGRKLIAVVYADMVDYSRLIGLDDAGTLRRLLTLRRELIDPAIREHGGRVVQTGGDSLLVAFDSIDGAVRCAVKVQQQVPVYDGDQPPDRRIRFRVGINIGDVIPHGTDLYGDGVNIAARLQAECPVGCICVSRTVRDHVHSRLNLYFEELGPLTLKNIARPVEAFLLRPDTIGTDSAISDPKISTGGPRLTVRPIVFRPSIMAFAALAVLAFAILGAIAWPFLRAPHPAQTVTAIQDVGIKNAPRLSLVVLPFQNLGGSPSDDYLADGITDDLTTDISHIGAFVIARESAYTYKGKSVDVKRIGEELGVRYLLEGSVRRLGDVLRVNAQLISTESGAHLWADRFDEQKNDLAAGQEEIVQRIGNALGWEMVRIETERGMRDRSSNPDAFDLILRARWLYHQPYSLQRLSEIVGLLDRAIQLDPSSVTAKVFLAAVLISQANETGRLDDGLARPATLLSDAAAANPSCCNIPWTRAYLLWSQRRWPEALAAAQQAMDLYPNSASAADMLAYLKLAFGDAEEAIFLLKQAIRLDPRGSILFQRYRRIGQALLVLGREEESIPWFQRALASNPDAPVRYRALEYRMLAAAYALSGREGDAHQALTEAADLDHRPTNPNSLVFSANEVAAAQNSRYAEGLRGAGFPIHADEDEDFGVLSDGKLSGTTFGYSPTTALGATTINTADLVSFLAKSKPIVIDTLWNYLDGSIPGAVGLTKSGLGGDYSDSAQNRLRTKMLELTKGDLSKPIVAVGWNSKRFDGYNLTLRLVALGYTKVYWYRGGRDAWEAHGLPKTKLDIQDW